MKTINLILGNHNHQPVGNFDFVFENTYNNSYKPFIETLQKYKHIKFNLHYTGCLLNWIEQNHPEHLEILKELLKNKQIEMQSGGFYEPIMPSIPDKDKDSQIKKLNEYLEKKLNYKAQGAWLAERVWEPTLVKNLAKNNLKYIMLDDSQLLTSGIDLHNMYGYFVTDNENYKLNIFPISKELRYLIPFREVEESIEYLKSIATEEGDRVIILHDDGEKYGDWPGTKKWVYEDKWLEKFFEALTREKDIIKTTTYSEYMSKYSPISKVYIPTGSYEEMLTWVLPSNIQYEFHNKKEVVNDKIVQNFMRGGFWRNYFMKYSESNKMNKRMIYASTLLEIVRNKKDKEKALDYLLKGQCNCPYWHGTFGGLYLNNLRHATYSNLIKSTHIAEKSVYGSRYFIKEKLDFDFDGRDEVIISSNKETIILHSLSGSIAEWDIKKENPINLIDTIKRTEEAYHIAATKSNENHSEKNNNEEHISIHSISKTIDEKIKKYLVFDKNEKYFAVDHILKTIPNSEDFQLMKYQDEYNLYNQYYTILENEINDNIATITFKKELKEISLIKKYTIFQKGGFDIFIEFENKSDNYIEFIHALENNITLLASNENDRYYIGNDNRISNNLSETNEFIGKSIGMVDESYIKIKVTLESSDETKFLYMPNYTISDAVDKLEMNYQNSTIVSCKEIKLNKNEKFNYIIKVKTKNI